jgi:3-oxoacyl-[acyl-carrier protein] reductase
MKIDLSGEVALVTGASSGIGRAIAGALEGAGATVAAHSRKEADLAREEEVRRLHEEVGKAHGPVTILVNNAGFWEDNPAGGPGTQDRYRRMMAVNLEAAYLLSNLVVPAMKERGGGVILNISSRAGKRGEPSAAQYAISKGGINAMTVSLARELAEHGIRVNAVAPGFIEVPRIAESLKDPELRKTIEEEIVLRRVGVPDDIAGAALFLVSPLASYITGQILHVNGGSYLNT